MFVTIRVYKRPNASALWHINALNAQAKEYTLVDMSYESKKTRIINTPNELTLEITNIWESKEVYEQYWQEPVVIDYFKIVNEHCEKNGIIAEPLQFLDL